jgi:16S rRNA processing protein RimM
LTSSTTDSQSWLSAGVVGSPHGLDGSVHVIRPRAELLILGGAVVVQGVQREIVRRAGTDVRPIIRLAGYDDRTAAEALRGAELMVGRVNAPPLGDDEWWAEDLEGCAVRDGARAVGTVSRLLALPSCEALEVSCTQDGRELLVPLVIDAVRSVDIGARLIDIDLKFLGEH